MKRMNLLLNILVVLVLVGCSANAATVIPSPIPSSTLPPSPMPTQTLPPPTQIPYLALPFPIQKPSNTLPVPSHIYAFGDSMSDNGNLKKLAPDIFSDNSSWNGRSSNGPVAVEVLATQLGVELTDYAVGGALSDTSNVNNSLGENTGYLAQIKKFQTDMNGKNADPKALYFIMIGANDYFTVDAPNSELAEKVVNNIAAGVNDLATMGAKRFLIVGPLNFGIVYPLIHSGDPNQPANAIDFQNQMDAKLTSRIKELNTQWKVEITYFDYAALSAKILNEPFDYGLTNITDRCLVSGYVCALPDEYYIWDDLGHPTRRVHDIFGKTMAAIYGK